MSQRPPESDPPRPPGQAPIEPRSTAPPPASNPSKATGGPPAPPPDRGKLREGLLLFPKLILFLIQLLVYTLGWILFQLGRLLINVSRLREEPTQASTGPPQPPYSWRSN